MSTWKFYTPDGVMDWMPDDCEAKRRLESGLRQLFTLNGYREIETPGIEFYDAYAAGGGFAPQESLFKFFDEKGRILCLRYDGTIPAARLASTLLRDAVLPLRLSYVNEMYRYQAFGGGRQREFTQAGVELMGVLTPEADAEVIALAIEGARACGIENLQVSLGQVAFFKGLMSDYAISDESAKALQRCIDGKEMVALEELVSTLKLPAAVREALLMMPQLYGTFEVIDQLKSSIDSPLAIDALDNLRDVLRILQDDGFLDTVTLDLGMLQSLDYYSGTIFKGFTYGLGFPIFSGGRYDRVTEAFGRSLASTGFSIGLNLVLTALRRQQIDLTVMNSATLVGYAPQARSAAYAYARSLRASGNQVIMDCQRLKPAQLLEQAARCEVTAVRFVTSAGEVKTLAGDRP